MTPPKKHHSKFARVLGSKDKEIPLITDLLICGKSTTPRYLVLTTMGRQKSHSAGFCLLLILASYSPEWLLAW